MALRVAHTVRKACRLCRLWCRPPGSQGLVPPTARRYAPERDSSFRRSHVSARATLCLNGCELLFVCVARHVPARLSLSLHRALLRMRTASSSKGQSSTSMVYIGRRGTAMIPSSAQPATHSQTVGSVRSLRGTSRSTPRRRTMSTTTDPATPFSPNDCSTPHRTLELAPLWSGNWCPTRPRRRRHQAIRP